MGLVIFEYALGLSLPSGELPLLPLLTLQLWVRYMDRIFLTSLVGLWPLFLGTLLYSAQQGMRSPKESIPNLWVCYQFEVASTLKKVAVPLKRLIRPLIQSCSLALCTNIFSLLLPYAQTFISPQIFISFLQFFFSFSGLLLANP